MVTKYRQDLPIHALLGKLGIENNDREAVRRSILAQLHADRRFHSPESVAALKDQSLHEHAKQWLKRNGHKYWPKIGRANRFWVYPRHEMLLKGMVFEIMSRQKEYRLGTLREPGTSRSFVIEDSTDSDDGADDRSDCTCR